MIIEQAILLGVISLVLGISIGQLVGMRSMKPIIDSYKRTIEGYKETLKAERESKEMIIEEYKKLISILKGNK